MIFTNSLLMCGPRKSNFFLVDKEREDPNTTKTGRTDDGPNIECWLGSFAIFQALRTSIAKEPYSFVMSRDWAGSGPPVIPSGSAHDAVQCHMLRPLANASYTFATVVVRFCLRFSLRFFGIVGGYKLRRMCLHCLRSPYDFFRRQTRTKTYRDLAVIVRQPQGYRTIIVLSSRPPFINRTMPHTMTLRNSHGVGLLTVKLSCYYVHGFKRPSLFIFGFHLNCVSKSCDHKSCYEEACLFS